MKNFILILIFLKIILSQIIFPFTIKTNENIKDPEEYIKNIFIFNIHIFHKLNLIYLNF